LPSATACSGEGAEAESPGATDVAASEDTQTQANCGDALTTVGGEFSIEVGGRERDAIIHVPSSIDATPLPW
jgi:poly(3-hydroxybutyrate) depolymerase